MSDIFQILSDDLVGVESDLGAACPKFFWNQATYNGFPSIDRDAKMLDVGGFQPGSDLSLIVRADQFPTLPSGARQLPETQQDLIYPAVGGHLWRIETIEVLPGGTLLRLRCVDTSQGA